MIKLKDLLKESYVWERKFGEKLPTLADVQRKKLKEDLFITHPIKDFKDKFTMNSSSIIGWSEK